VQVFYGPIHLLAIHYLSILIFVCTRIAFGRDGIARDICSAVEAHAIPSNLPMIEPSVDEESSDEDEPPSTRRRRRERERKRMLLRAEETATAAATTPVTALPVTTLMNASSTGTLPTLMLLPAGLNGVTGSQLLKPSNSFTHSLTATLSLSLSLSLSHLTYSFIYPIHEISCNGNNGDNRKYVVNTCSGTEA
jgi:hypothetical protein